MNETFFHANNKQSITPQPVSEKSDQVPSETTETETASLVQDIGQKTIGATESTQKQENTGKEYLDSVIDSVPAIDTAESLRNHHEKLKKGIKIVVGGPPHSGKSVFINGLTHILGDDNAYLFNATPDGEGEWLHRHYNNPEVAKLRQKGSFTPKFVMDCQRKISDWDGPLMIIDIGGKPSMENAQIIKGATHAIILASDLSKVTKWRGFFEAQHIPIIAKLHSNYSKSRDIQLPQDSNSDHITGMVHHLERGESPTDRETIKQVAGYITDLVDGNLAYQEAHINRKTSPFEVLVSDIARRVSNETIDSTVVTQDGQSRLIQSQKMLRSAIPEIYKITQTYKNRPVWLRGPLNSWESTAMTLALEEAGSTDVRLFSPDGYVAVKALPESEALDHKWWDEPVIQGKIEDKPIYSIHNTAHFANNPVMPDDLKKMTIPKLPEDAIVIISSQGPNWLKASIASGYKGKVSSIATFKPGEGATVVWSTDKDALGGRIFTNENEPPSFEKPIISVNQYLDEANRNLIAMSRTAHGIIDTSASGTKKEAIAIDERADVAGLIRSSFDRAIEMAYSAKSHHFENIHELRTFIESMAATINGGIVKDGMLIRNGEDSSKYPYARIADLPKFMDEFYEQLYARMNSPEVDPIETAAFAEYGIDLTGHFFSDGCGKTAKAVSSFVLMRANHKLPDYSRGNSRSYQENRAEYYSHAPKQIPGLDPTLDERSYNDFVEYYRSLF